MDRKLYPYQHRGSCMVGISQEVKVTLAFSVLRNRARSADLVNSLPEEASAEEILAAAKEKLRQIKAIRTATKSVIEDVRNNKELIYAVRSLAFCGIPYEQPDSQEVIRRIRMWQGELVATYASAKPDVSVVYGNNDRRFFGWLCSEAIKQGSNKILLPDDLSTVLDQIGWSDSSGYEYFYDSYLRWRHNSITLEFIPRVGEKPVPVDLGGKTGIIKAWHLPRYRNAKPENGMPWFLELSLDFYEVLCKEPFPIPLEYLKPFLESPLGWDFAIFLAVRVAAARSESRIPIVPTGRNVNPNMITLKDQLGSTDSNRARFIGKLRKFLVEIKKEWTDLQADIVDNMLVVRPSTYMVPYTGSKGGFLSAFEGLEESPASKPLFEEDDI